MGWAQSASLEVLERSRARQQEMEQKLEDAQLRLEEARREAARASSALGRAEVVAGTRAA
jgi:hypothetical protein